MIVLTIGMLLLGILIGLSLSHVPVLAQGVAALISHSPEIASILASYAFTVAGFLATIVTFLFSFQDQSYFRHSQKTGYFRILMFQHLLAMLVLLVLFGMSLALLAYPSMLKVVLSITAVSLAQLALIIISSYGLIERSSLKVPD